MGQKIFLLTIQMDRVETVPPTSFQWCRDLFKKLLPLFPEGGIISGVFLEDRGWVIVTCPHLNLPEEVEILLENMPFPCE